MSMKILIIEDDAGIVETMSMIIKIRWPDCNILSTPQGKPGIELIEVEDPDLIFLDLGLPDISGFDVLKQARIFTNTPIIVVTVHSEQADIVRALEMGADDYLVKPFEHLELLARTQAVIRRSHSEVEDVPITIGNLHFGPSFSKLTYEGKDITLTNTEGLLLYHLMKNAGSVLDHTTLAEKIWGDYYPGAVNNIRVIIKHLRNKLEKNPDKPQLIMTKIGTGYYFKKPD
jgi:DNA-binding response OmpR family regulator